MNTSVYDGCNMLGHDTDRPETWFVQRKLRWIEGTELMHFDRLNSTAHASSAPYERILSSVPNEGRL